MSESLALLLLVVVGIGGLALIPLGLPGLWLILLGIIGYGWYTDFSTYGLWFLLAEIALAFLGEVLESWIGFRFTRRYGGSRRGGGGGPIGGGPRGEGGGPRPPLRHPGGRVLRACF